MNTYQTNPVYNGCSALAEVLARAWARPDQPPPLPPSPPEGYSIIDLTAEEYDAAWHAVYKVRQRNRQSAGLFGSGW